LVQFKRMALRFAVAGLTVVGLLGAACAEDEGVGTSTPSTKITTPAASPKTTTPASGPATTKAAATVPVVAVDYAFQGLPDSIAASSALTLTNRATSELHELVALRIPDSERRPVAELVRLPEQEIEAIFGAAPPATVILAPPGQAGQAVVGDGRITQAGRYAIVCFIPTGADPQEYMRAAQANPQGPPQVEGGPPHVAQGMFEELTVR
jgi:hypothetical protein